jgi:hypothetical protein
MCELLCSSASLEHTVFGQRAIGVKVTDKQIHLMSTEELNDNLHLALEDIHVPNLCAREVNSARRDAARITKELFTRRITEKV